MIDIRALAFDLDLRYLNPDHPGAARSRLARAVRGAAGRIRGPVLNRLADRAERAAAARIASVPDLARVHDAYIARTRSAAVGAADYWTLYATTRWLAPRAVLECGTGLSTTAIGVALLHNARDGRGHGVCHSMEESSEWHAMAADLLPDELAPHVRLHHAPRVEDDLAGAPAVRYAELPKERFDMAFVDGPTTTGVDGTRHADMDLAIAARSSPDVLGIIDHRIRSAHRLTHALRATHHFHYHPATKVGHFLPRAWSARRRRNALAAGTGRNGV